MLFFGGGTNRMRKKGLVLVVMLGIILSVTGITQAFQNEPEGFRGIKWGDPPPEEDMEDWTRIGGNDFSRYERKNDKLQMGGAKLQSIEYQFYKGQFMEAWIQTEASNYKPLEDVVKLNFGTGYFEDYSSENIFGIHYQNRLYQWSGNLAIVILTLRITSIERLSSNWGYLTIRSTKIYNQYQEDIRLRNEEEARRKEEERQRAAEEGLADFDLPPIPAQQKEDEEARGTLEKERSKTEVSLPTPSLFIKSNPPEASIYINGQSCGLTPKNIHDLEEGTYEIILAKEGYKTYTENVKLSSGDEVPIEIDLAPQKGNLVVVSESEGVDVYLDGVYQGKTNLTLEDILAITHRVTLKKEGYYEEEKEVEIIYEETVTCKVTLKEKPGSLLILSSPQDADVSLNEEYKGKTPLSLSSIPPGEHKIKITRQGRAPYYEIVSIKGEQNITLDVVLLPNNPPKIISLIAASEDIRTEEIVTITCVATDIDGNNLSYAWLADEGSIQGQGQEVAYQAPDKPGTYLVRVEVIDNNGGKDIKEIPIMVKEQTVSLKIISYPGGAKIYINEIYRGEAPLTLSNIEVGYYKVKAIKEEVKEETVYARPKQITSIEFSFAPPLNMVFISAGEFLMGSNNDYHENPVHKAYLDAFYIDKYEITNLQFCEFLNEEGNQEEDGETWLNIDDESSLIERKKGKYQPKSGYENHPVIMVTWYGASAYAKWADKRLPTEAEWEKAARGGLVGKRYSWGDDYSQQQETCNSFRYSGDHANKMSPLLWGYQGTLPVGSFPSNSFGIYDMTGNIEEWCADWFSFYFTNPYENPQGPSKGPGRNIRGGSWMSNEWDLDCAHRGYADPYSSYYCLGFRCARSATE